VVIGAGHIWIHIVLFQMSSKVAIERRVTVEEHVGHFDLKLHSHVVLELVESFARSGHSLVTKVVFFDEARRWQLECDDAGVATSLGRRKSPFEIANDEVSMRDAFGMFAGLVTSA
jgi:hypothetical protein